LVNEAFEDGTVTWNNTLAKCFYIILIAAVGSSPGDVTIPPLDQHILPFMVYEDFVIRLKERSNISDLDAVVSLHNEKGDKYV
jgi:hypothetical protein